jgi:two-component system response regulator GlrR
MSETSSQLRPGLETGSPIDRPTGRRRSDRVVGAGRATQEAVDRAMAAAASDRPVLVSGPPGSGKQHLARAIHAWSARAGAPLVVVSCAALDAALLARELFGCTASVHARLPDPHAGALECAAGGTAIVDALDRAPEAIRGALTKAIAEGCFRREGDGTPVALQARIVVTTNEPLAPALFPDLPFHSVELLSLAERREDILPLAVHFLRLAADEEGIAPVGFTADARTALLDEEWPGNVRELAERVRQAVKLAGSGSVSAEALLLAFDGENVPSFKDAKRAFETRYVRGLLRRCGGNISRAARLARKDRKDFYDVIRRTGIDPSEFR